MHNPAHTGEINVGERYILNATLNARPDGMTALKGFDQLTEHEVFVKARNPELDHNAALRISREADVLASLEHPQIPGLVDADPDADRPYIVTELSEHHPKVAEGFKTNPHPVFAAQLCLEALKPLSYAHEKGLTHRDIKPANLLMTWEGDVALSDWEIALCQDRAKAQETYTDQRFDDWRVTRFGMARGSKGYMSPEQAEGRYKVQDARSDLYSLGAVLHVFLHYELPRSDQADRPPTDESLEPATTENRLFLPGRPVPGVLQEIAERALQSAPEDRFQSAAEMSQELERYLHSVGAVALAA